MYLGYFVNNRFPFPQGRSDGPFKTFPGSPRGSCGMGFFRPNQAVSRVYTMRRGLNGLGDDVTVSQPLLIGGIVALAAAMFLFGGRATPKLRKRKAARLRKRYEGLGAQLKRLEA